MVRVRFAPSPTGFLHIGGARTALFNWMYARSQPDGKFILRIEDTDLQRSEKRFEDEILDSMQWLGMNWDELYHQSERFEIYRQHAQKLLDEGKAFKDGDAVILKMTPEEVKIYDLIRGEITFDTSLIKDQVLMKSDGSPAYSFACVVDDALMDITCVVRGEDHISNTPKQIMIYKALGFKTPKFAHLPLIMGEEGGRLSKRHGAVAVSEYRTLGFLPEGIVNYLMLLGWSPGGNQEIVKMSSALKTFSIKKINKAGAEFSMDKLKWVNAQYIKQTPAEELAKLIKPFLITAGYDAAVLDETTLRRSLELYKSRLNTLADFMEWSRFLFTDEIQITPELKEQYLSTDHRKEFQALSLRFQTLASFDSVSVEQAFKAVMEELGRKPSELTHSVRVAVSGQSIGPSLFEAMSLLGKDKVVNRLRCV